MNRAASRAEVIMIHPHSDTRCAPRVGLHLSASARVTQDGDSEHVALIRDISTGGIFFYSDFAPKLGADIRVEFSVNIAGKRLQFELTCKAIRIVDVETGAIGVAARLQGCSFMLAA